MTKPINTTTYISWCEHNDEHNDHQGCAPHLTFQNRSQQIESSPVYDHISYDDSDDSIEGSWCSCFHILGLDKHTKNIGNDSWEKIDYDSPNWSESVLNSWQEKKSSDDIAKNMQEVDMQKDGC